MKILVCTDGSEYAVGAIKFAARFAKNYKADLTMVYVIESEISREKPVSDDYGDEQHKANEIIRNAEEIVSQIAPDVNANGHIAVGPISGEIVRVAEDEKFDVIAIGTRGQKKLRRMLLGSVADDVIRHAHCPVVVVR